MKKTIIILSLFIVVLLGGLWIWQTNQSKQYQGQNTQQNVEQNINQNQESEVITSDWEEYNNSEFGFSFRHPKSVSTTEEKDEKYLAKSLFKFSDGLGHFWLYIKSNPEKKDADAIRNEYYQNDIYGYSYEEEFPLIYRVKAFKQGRYDLGVIEKYYIPYEDHIFIFDFEYNFNQPNESLRDRKKLEISRIIDTLVFGDKLTISKLVNFLREQKQHGFNDDDNFVVSIKDENDKAIYASAGKVGVPPGFHFVVEKNNDQYIYKYLGQDMLTCTLVDEMMFSHEVIKDCWDEENNTIISN